jgi:hypothetical protein
MAHEIEIVYKVPAQPTSLAYRRGLRSVGLCLAMTCEVTHCVVCDYWI